MKTAIIMSKEEALALPVKSRPLCFRLPSKIYHDVFEAVGEASMQWRPRPSSQVFDSEGAANVAVKLCFKIAEELERIGITYEQSVTACSSADSASSASSNPSPSCQLLLFPES